MSGARLTAAAAAGVLRRDLAIFLTYRTPLVTQITGVLFTLAIFYYVSRLVSVPPFESPDEYFAFAAVGILILQVLESTFGTAAAIRQELVAGTFERMLVSPFGPVYGALSLFLFPVLYGVFLMVVGLALSALIFGIALEWPTVPLAVPVAVLGALAFGGVALLLAATVVRFKQPIGGTYVLAVISLVAGLYFPTSLLPSWLRWASEVQPFTPAVELLRHLLIGLPLSDPAGLVVGKLAAFTALLVPLGVMAFAAALRSAQRRGTILEY